MPLATDDALGNYAFQVEVDGITLAQFREVSGLSSEIQVIEYKSNKPGGIPMVKKLPGARKWGDIQLKRGKTSDKSWWDWIKQVQEGKIEQARRNGSIVIYDYERGEQARYNFTAGWPSKVSVSSLQASGNDVAIEEMTIVHEGLEVA
jgi:phage tail-like protein